MKKNCYLDSEDIPPIGELEHLNKKCFCYLCTCGEHLCPSVSSYKRPSIRTTSNYRERYKGRRSVPPEPFKHMNEFYVANHKMELVSSNQADFARMPLDLVKTVEVREARNNSPFKFIASSTYKNNFVQHGNVVDRPMTKANKEAWSPIKFTAKSTYAECFSPIESTKVVIEKMQENKNILGKGDLSLPQSTNKSTYTRHQFKYNNSAFRHNSVDYSCVMSASPTFSTTYANNFIESPRKQVKPTLHQLEKAII